ncbi:hypothetical protein [Flavobacterium sp. ov086]|uniref:hypothetical protein n=1 Tax=Flavobacterium sp. ov086 TaxID=1761785 RepID=UPI000B74BDA6|nr:hypothetical protein [Flavobacterium sp. ov086]SNR71880.1 hypothetical protein SAMN04487979_11825 [Flavobacterium sp. ov086]
MENQQKLFKGELMEELLRNYFLSLGYYVVRGVKFQYQDFDVSDIDLYLYGRASSLTRERINVDIKNKKSPQVFERIIWANGVMKLLGFDSCIVATTDEKPVIHSFGQLHNTVILDGSFLSKLRGKEIIDRFSEEELLAELSKHKSYKTYNKDWRYLYENSKSKLLNEQDYSGFNSTLILLKYFVEKSLVDVQKAEIATRMIYILLSHLLVIMDFILKDIAFLDTSIRMKRISEGLNYGNLGKDGVNKIIEIAYQIAGKNVVFSHQTNLDILIEYFSKLEISKKMYSWAKEFETLGYSKTFTNPNLIENIGLKGPLFVILDYMNIERRKFFNQYENAKSSKENEIVNDDLKSLNEKTKTEFEGNENNIDDSKIIKDSKEIVGKGNVRTKK